MRLEFVLIQNSRPSRVTIGYGRLRSRPATRTRGKQEWPDGPLREVSEGHAGARCAALAGGARTTRLRQGLRAGVEAVGRAAEDDPQRVPPDAVAERGADADRAADGRLLLRRKRGAAARLRPAAGEIDHRT